MKLTRKQIEFIQLALGGLVIVICALLSADPVRISLSLWFGVLWLVMAWKLGLSPLLVSLLVMMALRGEASAGLGASWLLSMNFGLSAVALACYRKERWAAVATAMLWGAMMWPQPALLLLVLVGFPRFHKMFGDQGRWFVFPGLILFCSLSGLLLYDGHLAGRLLQPFNKLSMAALLDRPFDASTYVELQEVFYQLFSVESLWRILPVIGIFELAQKLPDDHRFTWRNLMIFGAVLSVLIVPAGPAMEMIYLVGLPLASILLTRWFLALPDMVARGIFCVGMAGLALPFIQGGLS
ncbi:hypothetical protein P0Y35_10365 [Kiritimatiellaeota bacterium B1221]|nr:hypothetical protein [Kiritimatiellaeota bacterium B1221]